MHDRFAPDLKRERSGRRRTEPARTRRSTPRERAVETLELRYLLTAAGADFEQPLAEVDSTPWTGCTCGFCQLNGDLAIYAALPEPTLPENLLPEVLPPVASSGVDGGDDLLPQATNVPLSSIPALSSLPGATAKLYLNFIGDTTATWGSYSPGTTPAYNTDGDASTFSPSELSAIQEIWSRVAEKYSPFNIDVTTVDPGNINNLETMRIVVGGAGGWYGPVAGGIAYVGSFSSTNATTGKNIAFIFSQNLGNGNARYVAEAIAHEAGHTFNLQHQSVWTGGTLSSEYNQGDSLRAPVMGTSYYAARGLWWYGRTSQAGGPFQDDMAVIASPVNNFGYRPDDHGNSAGAATPLTQTGLTLAGSGVIETTADADYFSFTTTPGTVRITVSPAPFGAMLDASLELRDATGTLLVSAATSSLGESLSYDLAGGSYRIVVKSQGNYGDVGQYSLVATLPDAYENNDTRLAAADIGDAPGIDLPLLNIDRPGDDDWYRFTLDSPASIDVFANFIHSSGNLDLQVTNAAGTVIAASNTNGNGEFVQLPNLVAGTYYVHVYGVGGATNSYSLSIANGSLPLDLVAPQVTNVMLVGGGPIGAQWNVPVGSGEQISTAGVGKIKQIRIQFSEDVSVDQGDLIVTGANVPNYAFAGFGYDAGSRTAIWVLTAPIELDQIHLRLNADGASPIADLAGNRLDGEWNDPVSNDDESSDTFPSGNGVAGGDFYFSLSVLPGDANRDNLVDAADYTLWADHYLQAADWSHGDFNDDGFVDAADYTIWADHFLAPAAGMVPDQGEASAPASAGGEAAAAPMLGEAGVVPNVAAPVDLQSANAASTAAPVRTETPRDATLILSTTVAATTRSMSAEVVTLGFAARSSAVVEKIEHSHDARLAAVDEVLSATIPPGRPVFGAAGEIQSVDPSGSRVTAKRGHRDVTWRIESFVGDLETTITASEQDLAAELIRAEPAVARRFSSLRRV